MASVPDFAQICQDITAIKMCSICTTALWTYDYLLTVGDEIRYAWKTKSVPMLGLFLFIRYIPVPFLAWAAFSFWYTNYTPEICSKTAWIGTLYFALATACTQSILTMRTYAITRKNKLVAGILFTLATAELGIGIFVTVRSALVPGEIPVIPLPLYQMCFANVPKKWTMTQIAFLFAFDIAVFALVMVQMQYMKAIHRGIDVPNIFDAVSRDAGIYFGIIASSHFLVLVLYSVARPGLRGVGMVLSAVLIPMMISRIVISLKKAASERQPFLSLEVPSTMPTSLQNTYSSRLAEAIPLSILKGERV